MVMLPTALSLNPLAQKALAQSVNLGYAGRGVYRVSETNPERKGDYWFRDFGMVMACTYMTELGFRGTERYYTMPLLTHALELQALRTDSGFGQKRTVPYYKQTEGSQSIFKGLRAESLYPRAWNYSEMPEALRQKMMGTLIRNSAELVPQVLQEDALNEIARLKEAARLKKEDIAHYKTLERLITEPFRQGNGALVDGQIEELQLGQHKGELNRLAKIDNQEAATAEIKKFVNEKKLNADQVEKTLRLIKAEQTGILINHLDRNLNFQHYLENTFLKSKGQFKAHTFDMPRALRAPNEFSTLDEMTGIVSDRLRFYIEKLDTLQNKSKSDLRKLVEEVRKLPLDQREKAFNAKIGAIENAQFLYKKQSLTDLWHATANSKDGLEIQNTLQEIRKSRKPYGNSAQKAAMHKEWEKINDNCLWNWQNEFKVQKDGLLKCLTAPGQHSHKPNGYISINHLNTQLGHFEGWFEKISKSLDIQNAILDNLWEYLGADVLLQVKKKVKTAFEEVNKLSFDHLPKHTQGPKTGLSVTKQELLEARLKDMGIGHWLEPDEINRLSEDLAEHLPKMHSHGQNPKTLEQHSVEPVMDKVKKTIWAHLTGDMSYNTLAQGDKSFCPKLKEYVDAQLRKLPPDKQATLLAEFEEGKKIPGKLFRQLTNKDLFGNPDPLGKGMEDLLGKVLNTEFLHVVPDGSEKMVQSAEWTVKSLITDGLQSRAIKSAVDKIQKNGTWPKILATVGLNFVFYGWLASRFDNKVLQPYQEKLVARKGTAQDIVNAGYLGVIPALTVLSQAWDPTTLISGLKRMNHFSRFASVGGAALGVFAATSYGFLRVLEKKTPDLPRNDLASNAKNEPTKANSNLTPAQLSFNALPKPIPTFKPANPTPAFGTPLNLNHGPDFNGLPFQNYRPRSAFIGSTPAANTASPFQALQFPPRIQG